MALAACAFCVSAQDQYVLSSNGNVNLRVSPTTSAAKAGTLSRFSPVPLVEELDGWYKVEAEGKTAYVSQSVTNVCDALVPKEIYGKNLTSTDALDKIRFQGDITIEAVDNSHALITVNWMRLNLPAETEYFLADVKEGRITATHSGISYVDCSSSPSSIREELFELDHPLPVGFDEFNTTVYFNGGSYSEFE